MDDDRFRHMFDVSPVGQVLSTWEGRILHINQAGAALFGSTVKELEGQTALQFYRDEADRGAFLCELERTGTFVQRRLRARKKSGEPLELCVSARRVGNGVIRGVLWAFFEDAEST